MIPLENVLIFMATNDKSKFDKALLRPGRVDEEYVLDYANSNLISEYVSNFYTKDIKLNFNHTIGMATVQNICMRNRNNIDDTIKEINEHSPKED